MTSASVTRTAAARSTSSSGSGSGRVKRTPGSLRIIGGEFRRRIVAFDPGTKVRPTPDRVRQTLFDWLAPAIEEARCLD
ncbi:MAG: RsmD family RNA methyltransferase, partial [Dongiaceae bacterium]